MSGPSARFALAAEDRAPIDQPPELPIATPAIETTESAPVAPGDAAPEAERLPCGTRPGRQLGLSLETDDIDRRFEEIKEIYREFCGARNERQRTIMRGVLISSARRLQASLGHLAAALETRRPT